MVDETRMAEYRRTGAGSSMGGGPNSFAGGMEKARQEYVAMQSAKEAHSQAVMAGEQDAAKKGSENYQKSLALQKIQGNAAGVTPEQLAEAEKEGQKAADQLHKQYVTAEQIEKEEKISVTKLVSNVGYNRLFEEYGNNYFELRTVDKGEEIVLAGILKEIPEFSCSQSWAEGPGGTIGKKITEYMNDDTLQMISFIGGSQTYKPLIATDAMTERMYEGTSYGAIELNFRVYTGQNIGSTELTSKNVWIKSLLKYTSPEHENSDIGGSVENLKSAVEAARTTVNATIDAFKGNDGGTVTGFIKELNQEFSNVWSKRYGANRVYGNSNSTSRMGAKIFSLKLFPFIFKSPLTVYIDNWDFTPSIETAIDSDGTKSTIDSIYYDFKISCSLDQIPSKHRWLETLL